MGPPPNALQQVYGGAAARRFRSVPVPTIPAIVYALCGLGFGGVLLLPLSRRRSLPDEGS